MKLRRLAVPCACALAALALALASGHAARAEDTTIHVGLVRSVSNGAAFTAPDRGYLKQNGLNVVIDDITSSANSMVLLSTNRLQIVAGGVAAGYFNAVDRGLPVAIIADRVST